MIPSTKTPDPANHQYDIHDFFDALNAGQLPAVSYLKAPAYQDGHAGYSDPLDEQIFIVQVINTLQKTGFWSSTAVIIAYGDSDGMYDHQMPPIVNPSFSVADKLNGSNTCNHGLQQGRATPVTPLNGAFGYPAQGRCGYGTRVPLVVVSPFAKENFVDHTLTDQSSILRFIEDNWLAGQRVQPNGSFDTIAGPLNNLFDFEDLGGAPRKLFLDETTGAVSPANVGKGQRNARQVSPQQVSPQELSAVALSASSCPYLVDSNGTTLVDNNGRPITAC
jgi:phospholipase C